MSTTQPEPPIAPDPQQHQQGAHKRRNPWIWISALLAVVAVGLGIWAYSAQSDLDSTQQDVEELQAQVDQSKETGGTVLATVKAAFQDLTAQLGATNEDLANTKQQLQDAQASAEKAAQDAAAAVEGSTKQVQAKAQEAQSKATVAADCAKAYAGAFGALFEGDSVRAQAATVKQQLQDISATCKTALQGS
jgi:chromosome segregation ATPase